MLLHWVQVGFLVMAVVTAIIHLIAMVLASLDRIDRQAQIAGVLYMVAFALISLAAGALQGRG